MKKSLKILIIILAVSVLLLPFFAPHVYAAGAPAQECSGWTDFLFPSCWIPSVEKIIAESLLFIGSTILSLCGLVFDKIIDWTIVNMATNLNDPSGIGGGINSAWATLRDIANMVFIFVLLWAAIQTILELNTGTFGKTIKNIIIIALLINFSLFLTKVVIDASNIATIGFYNSIISGGNGSLSTIFTNATKIQSFYGPDVVEAFAAGNQALMTGILGLITMLILSIVLIIASVLFAARYIILIFLMILSPLAFIGYIIPGMSGKFKEWWKQLINQSFFAPYFMLLIWVAIKLITSNNFVDPSSINNQNFATIVTSPQGAIGLILKYVLVIGFIIGAIILSKKMATSTTGFSAVAGGVITGAAFAGRQTVGRGSRAFANSERMRELSKQSGVAGSLARTGLWTANKGQKASFDLRGVPGGKSLTGDLGKLTGKDGFKKSVEDKAKAKATYAKDIYGMTDKEKKDASDRKKEYEGEDGKSGIKREFLDARKTDEQRIRAERDVTKKKAEKAKDTAKADLEAKTKVAEEFQANRLSGITVDATAEAAAKKSVEEAKVKLAETEKAHNEAIEKASAKIEDTDYNAAVQALKKREETTKLAWEQAKTVGEKRMNAYADRIKAGPPRIASAIAGGLVGSAAGPVGMAAGAYAGWKGGKKIGEFIGGFQGNKAAEAEIRKTAKEKTTKDKLADDLKAYAKENPDADLGGAAEEPEKSEESKSGDSTKAA